MRQLYSLLMLLLTPVSLGYFALRGLRDRRYWKHWGERLGVLSVKGPVEFHIHAASLGEVNAAGPLVNALLERETAPNLLLTTFTPTGRQRARELFGARVQLCYLPLDLPGIPSHFLRKLQPAVIVIVETEIWPNFYAAAARADIPLIISNARLSQASLRAYRRCQRLIGPALRSVRQILAQSDADAQRYVQCGAEPSRVSNAGNLKFDIHVPASLLETGELLRSAWGVQRPVLVAGSTHEDDELVLLKAFRRLLERHPEALLVLAPRHPERFARAEQLLQEQELSVQRRSDSRLPGRDTQCLLIDSMGELLDYYAAADITFVGGTIADIGGHNLLEPAALAKPLLFGPHTAHVKEIATRLLESGAARRVLTARDVFAAVDQLFAHPATRDRMGQAGLCLLEEGRGALQKSVDAIGALSKDARGTTNGPG